MQSNLRQPGNTTNISDNNADHLARGSGGGTDLTDPYGTPVHAQLDGGVVTIVDNSPNGSGGRYSRVTGPDGDSVESLHQHAVTAVRGTRCSAETVIGISGASAFGSNFGTGGPHIHNHGVQGGSGRRINLEAYYWWLNNGHSTAGGNATPIDNRTPEEKEMDYLMTVADNIVNDIKARLVEMEGRLNTRIEAGFSALAKELDVSEEDIKRAIRTEARPKLYRVKDGEPRRAGAVAAIDTDTGYLRNYTHPDQISADWAASRVSPTIEQVSLSEFERLEREAREQLERLK